MVVLKEDYADGNILYVGDDLSSGDSGLNLTSKQINKSKLFEFGGDSSDGALSVTSGTTNLTPGQWYQYSSITITGGTLSFTTAAGDKDGVLWLKCAGDMSFTGGTIDLSAKGGPGGAAVASSSLGNTGTAGGMSGQTGGTGGNNNGNGGAGGTQGGGTSETTYPSSPTAVAGFTLYGQGLNGMALLVDNYICPGSGGGSGGAGAGQAGGGGGGGGSIGAVGTVGTNGVGGGSGISGKGGNGGAGIYIEIFGTLNFGASATIDVSGENGDANASDAAGAGGGGSGGTAWLLANGTIIDSGTKTTTGGTGGTATGAGGDGGNGGVGTVDIEQVTLEPALS